LTVRKLQIADTTTRQAVELIRERVNATSDTPIVEGSLESADLPDDKNVVVRHGLGRKPDGFLLASLKGATAAGYILDVASDTSTLTVKAKSYGATVSVKLWVF
jgi:hypothetical protein